MSLSLDIFGTFQFLSTAFKKEGIDHLLIGGFAVNHYKVSRQTADVDLLLLKKDFKKAQSLLENAGYEQDFEDNFFAGFTNNQSLLDIDFMFVDEETFRGLKQEGTETFIGGFSFLTPSLNHLIALKLHSILHNPKEREAIDLPDIIRLTVNNDVDISSEEFKSLSLKYGSEELYNKIKEGTKK